MTLIDVAAGILPHRLFDPLPCTVLPLYTGV